MRVPHMSDPKIPSLFLSRLSLALTSQDLGLFVDDPDFGFHECRFAFAFGFIITYFTNGFQIVW